MSETFAEYVQRLRGYLGSKDPLQSMQETPSTLANLLHAASGSVLSQPPAPGKWSVQEIVAHLADAELVSGYRFRLIAGSDDGVPIQGYDQDRWAATGNYRTATIEQSLKSFTSLREMNVRFLRSLPASAWEKYGLHSERGRETLRDLVTLLAGHDLNHLTQIRNIISGEKAIGA